MRRATRQPARLSGAILGLLLLAGCASGTPGRAPRDALRALLAQLASGQVSPACARLTPPAVAELARDFGGATCPQTIATATRYIAIRRGEQAAVRAAVVLAALDIPLSPAPVRSGATAASVRVRFADPVLGRVQDVDIGLRLVAGTWRVDRGIDGLFTLLGPGLPDSRSQTPGASGLSPTVVPRHSAK